MHYENALRFLVACLRSPEKCTRYGGIANYGYGLYLPNIMRTFLLTEERVAENEVERRLPAMSPAFYDAAWELCRRGIIRPGLRRHGEQATADGGSGNGYSITPFGHQWLSEETEDVFIPTEPERFGQMLAPFRQRYGEAWHQRAQEAIRCYGAHAYLACCVMCGAAAESVMLTVACALKGEAEVLKTYNSSQGRSRIENLILGKADQSVQRDFRSFLVLLKYWRDAAGHGTPVAISDSEAYTSLALLLRFSQYVTDRWSDLVPA